MNIEKIQSQLDEIQTEAEKIIKDGMQLIDKFVGHNEPLNATNEMRKLNEYFRRGLPDHRLKLRHLKTQCDLLVDQGTIEADHKTIQQLDEFIGNIKDLRHCLAVGSLESYKVTSCKSL